MNRLYKGFRALAIVAMVVLANNEALACAVCPAGSEESRTAYYATTAFLSLLPLVMIGGVVYYIAKKSK